MYRNCIYEWMKIYFRLKCEKQIYIFFKKEVHFENCFEENFFEKTIKFA